MKWKHIVVAGVLGALLGSSPLGMTQDILAASAYAEMYHQGDLMGKTLFPLLAENYNRHYQALYTEAQMKAYRYGIEHGAFALVSPNAEGGYSGQWGLIGKDGNFIIPLDKYTYFSASGKSDEIYAKKDGEALTYDLQGNITNRLSKEETSKKEKESMEAYKKAGSLKIPDMSEMDPYRYHLDELEGVSIAYGETVKPWSSFGQVVKANGMFVFVNNSGNVLIGPGNFDVAAEGNVDKETGLIALLDKTTGKVGVFSMYDGTPVVPIQYDNVTFCYGKRILLERQDVAILVDQTTGNVVAELPRGNNPSLPQFGQFSSFSIKPFGTEEVTWISTFYDYDKGELGEIKKLQILDRNGVVRGTIDGIKGDDIILTMIEGFKNGYAPVKIKGKWGIVDSDGNWIVQPIYKSVEMM